MSKEMDNTKIVAEFQAGMNDITKMIYSFVEKGYDAASIYLIIVFADKITKMLMKETYPTADDEKFKTVSQVVDLAFEMYKAGLEQQK